VLFGLQFVIYSGDVVSRETELQLSLFSVIILLCFAVVVLIQILFSLVACSRFCVGSSWGFENDPNALLV